MPFPNYHAARVRDPDLFIEDRMWEMDRAESGSILFIGGKLKTDPGGPSMLQSIRFAKEKFTPEAAKLWLKDHDKKIIAFEEATKADSADSEDVLRFDRSSAGKVERTDSGFLMANAVITRAGVFSYRMANGTTRQELRPPEEVFHPDSMKTAEMLPVTNDHPYREPGGRVTVENAKALAVGFTGQDIRQDGMTMRAPLKITTEDGVKAVENGRRELSLGYRCRIEKLDGVWEGQTYTHVQRRIRCNHLALVDEARAGHVATLRLDGADAVMVNPDTGKEPKMEGSVRLDSGIDYPCAPEVAVEVEKLRKDRSELKSKLDSASKDMEALQGKHDALASKVEELEKRDDSAEVQTRVKARIALETAARPRLSKEDAEKLDGMSDDDIRKAVILAKSPKADLEGKGPEYLSARFDAICEEPEERRDDGQGRKVVGSGEPTTPVDAEQARLDSQRRAERRSRGLEPEEKKSA